MNRGIRLLLTAVVLLQAAAATPAPAAPNASISTGGYRAYEIVRAKQGGPRFIDITVGATHDDGILVGVLAIARERGRRALTGAFVGEIWHAKQASAYAGGQEVTPGCVPQVPCMDFTLGASVVFGVPTYPGMSYVVAGPAGGLTVKLSSKYWKVREIKNGARAVSAEDSAAGAHLDGGQAEVFTSAQAAGGKYGSFTVARIPCGGDWADGEAAFTGASAGGSVLTCHKPDEDVSFGTTFGPTTWALQGRVVSVGQVGPTRLFVIDLPK